MKRTTLISLMLVIMLFVTIGIIYGNKISENTAILIVNGEEVDADEYQFMLDRQRASVYGYYYKKYGVADSNQFWITPIHGEVPLTKAKQQATEEVLKARVLRGMAKRLGIISNSSFASFIKSMVEENNKRDAAYRKGEVVYGPINFDLNMYYEYWTSNVIAEVKKKLEIQSWNISDQELSDYYESIKSTYFRRDGDLTTEIIKFHYADQDSRKTDEQKELGRVLLEKARQDIEPANVAEKGEKLSKRYPGQVEYSQQTFYQMNQKANIQQYGEVWNSARQLNIGQISQIIEWQGSLLLVKLVDRKNDGFQEYSNVMDSVKQLYINKLFDEELAKEVKSVIWRVNPQNLDQILM